MPGPVFLGKIQINWCMNCNLPILEESICKCDEAAKPVPLTPPGDAYPAMGSSLDAVRTNLDGAYGTGVGVGLLPENKLVLLSNIPSKDRAVEVVLDGRILGRSFYDPTKAGWLFKPTMEGARRLDLLTDSKKITVDQGASEAIGRGGSLLAPGVVAADQSIEAGDEVMILGPDGLLFAIGNAKMSGTQMVERNHGTASKVRIVKPPSPPHILPGGQRWEDAVEANEKVLQRREKEAIDFIRSTSRTYDLPRCVAFSGGKDSLCTLLLVSKAIDDFKVIFIDTGIEFPETVEYTHRALASLGMGDRLIIKAVGEGFWEAMKMFGPPARDARWCCKVCKLGPTTNIIQEHFGGDCLTFVGQRRYESLQRLGRRRVSHNPWVPRQIAASPIRDWTALHVWLYNLREGAEMNPLYYLGYARIGCFVCPASEMAELDLLGRTHPELSDRLLSAVKEHGERAEMPEDWLKLGLWRWRKPPAWAPEDVKAYQDPFEYLEKVEYKRSQVAGGTLLSAELGDDLDMERIENLFKALGAVECDSEGIHLRSSNVGVGLTLEGKLNIGPLNDENLVREVSRSVAFCLVKAGHCVGCGTCVGSCHRGAIRIEKGKAWIGEDCIHCSSCVELCPLLTWAVKEAARPFG